MKSNASLAYGLALIAGDFLALLIAFVGAYIIRVKIDDRPLIEFVSARQYFTVFLILLVFWVGIFALLGLYNASIYEKRFKEFGRLIVGSFLGLLFVLGVAYFSDRAIFPARLVPVYGFTFAFILLIFFRNFIRLVRTRLLRYGYGVSNLLIIGNTSVIEEMIELFKEKSSGYQIIGVAGTRRQIDGVTTYTSFQSAQKQIAAENIHSILQTELLSKPEDNNKILQFAQENHISYRFIPGNTELFVGNIDVELFRSSFPVIAVNQTALTGWGRIIKKVFDIIITLPLIMMLSPLYLLIALLIALSDFGPIVLQQKRVTRFNRIFTIYKFRTHKKSVNGMSPEEAFVHIGKPELIKQYRENGDQLDNDPRVTTVGRFLRATSLDELPQLFNVLKGDISLIGPRALVPDEIKLAKSKHNIVSVKAGLTGLAQVSGRKDISFEERRKLDLYYVQNWNFWLDVTILIKTIRVVMSGRGAV